MDFRNILAIILLVIFLGSCSVSKSIMGTYTPNGLMDSRSAIVLKENNRFIFSDSQHMSYITTSGRFEVSGDSLIMYSDSLENSSSRVEYLEDIDTPKLRIKVLHKDILGFEQAIPASVKAHYQVGGWRNLKCDNEGQAELEVAGLLAIEVRWITGIPISIDFSKVVSNNLKVTILEDGMGNTKFNGRVIMIKRSKLIDNFGDRSYKKLKGSL